MRSLRFSIAGLMVLVLVASLGLAALRSPSQTSSGALFYVTCGVLALATVGVFCGGEAARAWWLGFTGFGWGYLAMTYGSEYQVVKPPTVALFDALLSYLGAPNSQGDVIPGKAEYTPLVFYNYIRVCNSIFGLVAATLGGILAHALFGVAKRSDRPVADRGVTSRSPLRWWRRPSILSLMGLFVYTAAALIGARKAPGLWAGGTVLLTWGIFALLAVAAVCNQERRRAVCLGSALFGAGYIALVYDHGPSYVTWLRHETDYITWPRAVTNRLLNSLRPWLPTIVREFPTRTDGNAYANARAFAALEHPITMSFREEPLDDVLKYVVAATSEPDWPGLPIFVDPVGLLEAEKTIHSPVTLVMEGVPLRTTLHLVVKQLGMTYGVKDGVVTITSMSTGDEVDTSFYEDPFLVIGQCILALLAACLGGVLAPLVTRREAEQPG